MAREILIVKDATKPYWENERYECTGFVNPRELRSLFLKDLGLKSFDEYKAEGGDLGIFDEFRSKQLSTLSNKFPLITRGHDFYKDAIYAENEILGLIKEVQSVKEIVKHVESVSYLEQLLAACEMALEGDAGLQIIAD